MSDRRNQQPRKGGPMGGMGRGMQPGEKPKNLKKSIKQLAQYSTVIIVAQRISTILHAEQILVLDDGKVVGKGTHEELLKNCKVYQEIAKSQLSAKELGIESEVADHE